MEKKCESCGDDLTYIVLPEDYRITLTHTHVDFIQGSDKLINSEEYFCGLGCLKTWINKNLGDN